MTPAPVDARIRKVSCPHKVRIGASYSARFGDNMAPVPLTRQLRHFKSDDSIFIDDAYLIKGIAAVFF